MQRGNCYYSSEALYHILGGKRAGWKPMHMKTDRGKYSHWFLKHETGVILDPSVRQFKRKPDYTKARGSGFLTSRPSGKAKKLMTKLTWQEV